jgi:hypothetical protein
VTHKFAIGEAVEFRPGRSTSEARGVYIVIKQLPENDGEPEYRVRRPFEPQAAIRIAARSRRHTSTTNDHSLGLIIFLSRELGTVLPQPAYIGVDVSDDFRIPEEIPADEEFEEGAATQVLVNRYERDPAARERCIQHYGTSCFVCSVSLADR